MIDVKRFVHATLLAIAINALLGAVAGTIKAGLHAYIEAACPKETP